MIDLTSKTTQQASHVIDKAMEEFIHLRQTGPHLTKHHAHHALTGDRKNEEEGKNDNAVRAYSLRHSNPGVFCTRWHHLKMCLNISRRKLVAY